MFKVGQKVVCVDGKNFASTHIALAEKEIYTIRDIVHFKGEGIGIYLKEVINKREMFSGQEFGYFTARFRPIDFNFGEVVAEHIEEKINQEQLISI